MNIFKVGDVDVTGMNLGLARHPELWDQFTLRKDHLDPHKAMHDIWIRYNDIQQFTGDFAAWNGPHFPVWYPAWHLVPELRPIVMGLFQKYNGTHLGGVLITKIPAGQRIEAHVDSSWHAKFYTTKLYIVLRGNDKCVNRVLDERVVMKTGEVWYFNNNVEHDVINDGDTDRMTLIVCMNHD